MDHMLRQTVRNFPWAATVPDFKLAEWSCDQINTVGHDVSVRMAAETQESGIRLCLSDATPFKAA